ncbi:hypothetical protein BCR44DRAFT_36785 [Catenaria anguillulae PL171]|uniref:Uncharacterized protein n=1 Tax=Catenaria anguillulae PL171 TaxID=765915 RepID=A0A1Y2HXI5_9FUNG|nr:hypothetical protein BCR44DRAFT_36785 [Catenaria anguillulae PL171]
MTETNQTKGPTGAAAGPTRKIVERTNEELAKRIRELESQVESLAFDKTQLKTKFAQLKEENKDLAIKTSDANDDMAKIASLKAAIAHLEKQVRSLDSEKTKLKKQLDLVNKKCAALKQKFNDVLGRFTLCKAAILSMYHFPGHLVHLTHMNWGEIADANQDTTRADIFESLRARFKSNRENKGVMSKDDPAAGETAAIQSRWVMTGKHLLDKYPDIMDEFIASVEQDEEKMELARNLFPNFPYSDQ